MAMYGRDYEPNRHRYMGEGAFWNRSPVDDFGPGPMRRSRAGRGFERDPYDRTGMEYDRGSFGTRPTAGYDVGYRGTEREVYRPRGSNRGFHEERDMGDRLREGWNELKHNVRGAFSDEYDRGYRSDRFGGGRYESRYGGRTDRGFTGRRYDSGWW